MGNFKFKTGAGVMSKKRKNAHSKKAALPSKSDTGISRVISRRRVLYALAAVAVAGGGLAALFKPAPTVAEEVEVYKDPSCECCGRWVNHMRRNGFSVVVHNVEDMDTVKRRAGIPDALESCHTAFVGGYSVEGHVPASDIKKLITEKPAIKGLSVPGMPSSAPGMDSPEREPYTVLAFEETGRISTFASY